MLKNSFFKTIPFLLFIVFLNSCDNDFNGVGGDIIGENSFDILHSSNYSLIAYNQKIDPVQSNNLETNQFGIYDNPSFGTTTATFVTQLTLAVENPTIDAATVKIKSAVLTVPYFSHKDPNVAIGSDGSSKYILDSIYGPSNATMKLSVYESDFFMPDRDPEEQLTQPQKFYTNQYSVFFGKKKGVILNNSTKEAENTKFFFDPVEHSVPTTTNGTTVTTRIAPRMELNLDKEFFLNKILKAPAGSLLDNTVFKNYFRGLFFNIEAIDGVKGNMAMVNFKGGKITITYTETVDSKDVEKTLVLNLTGNTANLLTQSDTDAKYVSATTPANINNTQGDANLYLKGGEGSMAVLELFGADKFKEDGTAGANGFPDELDVIRKNKYLINEANIVFHVNSEEMTTSYLPRRIYLYDLTNSAVLLDYNLDGTKASDLKKNNYVFGGLLDKETDENGGGYYYKFRITHYIRSLVKADKYNGVKLGLVVTEDIAKTSFSSLKNKTTFPFVVPMASVMNPLGVILFGNNIPNTPSTQTEYNKRLKLEIYYTKPN